MLESEVLIRPYNPSISGEEGYVLGTWLHDLRDADPSGLPDDYWFPAHRRYAEHVLGDPAAVALVAVPSDGSPDILGYAVALPESLEWVHVRKPFRKRGLANLLLRRAGVLPTLPARWMTPLGRQYLENPLRGRQLRRK